MSKRFILCAALMLALAGCATAHIDHVVSAAAAPSQPRDILVEVTADPALDADDQAAARDASELLRKAMLHELGEAGPNARALEAGARPAGSAILHLAVTGAPPARAPKPSSRS